MLRGIHEDPGPLTEPAMRSWDELGSESDRAEIRQEITWLIRAGKVYVRPVRGDPERVEVIPLGPGSSRRGST